MNKEHLLSLLREHTTLFENNIARELEKTHDQWFEDFGFPIFGETSKDYHEQVYFQSYLESYTRKMINGIIKELCEEYVVDQIRWPEMEFCGSYKGQTNSEFEREFYFEFINEDTRTGYRYTYLRDDKVDEVLKAGDVDRIVLVIWQQEDYHIGFEYDDERVKGILLLDLFQELFYDLLEIEEIRTMYDIFAENITHAVEKANAMISLVTLPGFTPSYLHKNRKEVVQHLKEEVSATSSFYVKNVKYQETQIDSEKLISQYHLSSYFLNNELEQAFVGTSLYAKSFLTSEYLYKYFNNNPLFDYTPIVSGYLKSIEQLLDVICRSHDRNNNKNWENMGSYTMGSYIEYIRKHRDIFRNELQPAQEIIVMCLESYKVETRNNLFHKDYFYNWDRVIQIRKNTVFLYVTLLGSVNLDFLPKDYKGLGLLQTEYDKLFEILDGQEGYFLIELNGKAYSKMSMRRREKGLNYNLDGMVTNTIEFEKYEYDHYVTIEIGPRNMPTAIWKEDLYENRISQIWQR